MVKSTFNFAKNSNNLEIAKQLNIPTAEQLREMNLLGAVEIRRNNQSENTEEEVMKKILYLEEEIKNKYQINAISF